MSISICCWAGEPTTSSAAFGRRSSKESDGGQSERSDEIRRDSQVEQPRVRDRPKDLGADIVAGIRRLGEKDGPQLITSGAARAKRHRCCSNASLPMRSCCSSFRFCWAKANVSSRMELPPRGTRARQHKGGGLRRHHQYLQKPNSPLRTSSTADALSKKRAPSPTYANSPGAPLKPGLPLEWVF